MHACILEFPQSYSNGTGTVWDNHITVLVAVNEAALALTVGSFMIY